MNETRWDDGALRNLLRRPSYDMHASHLGDGAPIRGDATHSTFAYRHVTRADRVRLGASSAALHSFMVA